MSRVGFVLGLGGQAGKLGPLVALCWGVCACNNTGAFGVQATTAEPTDATGASAHDAATSSDASAPPETSAEAPLEASLDAALEAAGSAPDVQAARFPAYGRVDLVDPKLAALCPKLSPPDESPAACPPNEPYSGGSCAAQATCQYVQTIGGSAARYATYQCQASGMFKRVSGTCCDPPEQAVAIMHRPGTEDAAPSACPAAGPDPLVLDEVNALVVEKGSECGFIQGFTGMAVIVWFDRGLATHVYVYVPPDIAALLAPSGRSAETIRNCLVEKFANRRWSCALAPVCVYRGSTLA